MAFHDLNLPTEYKSFGAIVGANEVVVRHGFYARFGKRAFDLVLSALMLPVILPVMAVIFLCIRYSGGAALFSQPRVGRDGVVFNCYKFRTMVPDAEKVLADMCAADPKIAAEWKKNQKLQNDPRITRVGRILRKTSLDELPQIINVLKGEMSLVGPRPFMPAQKPIYDSEGGAAYYRLRPGVTGSWQVFSRHDTTFAARVRFDQSYGGALSFWNDVALVLRTGRVMLCGTGA